MTINRSQDPKGSKFKIAWVGNPLITNWHAGMTFVTFLLAPVASCTNHDLTCLTCCNFHFSIV
jgi:hypothetical protein